MTYILTSILLVHMTFPMTYDIGKVKYFEMLWVWKKPAKKTKREGNQRIGWTSHEKKKKKKKTVHSVPTRVSYILLLIQGHKVESHLLSSILHELFSIVLSHPHSSVINAIQVLLSWWHIKQPSQCPLIRVEGDHCQVNSSLHNYWGTKLTLWTAIPNHAVERLILILSRTKPTALEQRIRW